MDGGGATVVVGEDDALLDGVDVKDGFEVDDVFPSQAQVILAFSHSLVDGGLHFRESEGDEEMKSREEIDLRVVVIRLEVHHFLEVDAVEFSIHAETDDG